MLGVLSRTQVRRVTGAIALVVLAASGCGQPTDADERTSPVPARVRAMWDETAPWVDAAAPDPLLVPGPNLPASVEVTAIQRPTSYAEPHQPPPGAAPLDAATTLYADPTSSEPWADRAVVVGRVRASEADEGAFLFDEGTDVRIQGREGRVGRFRGLWFAA